MSCANGLLTVAAVVAFLFGAWPFAGSVIAPWIVGIAAIVILAVAWTGVTCTWCAAPKKSAAVAAPKKAKKKSKK